MSVLRALKAAFLMQSSQALYDSRFCGCGENARHALHFFKFNYLNYKKLASQRMRERTDRMKYQSPPFSEIKMRTLLFKFLQPIFKVERYFRKTFLKLRGNSLKNRQVSSCGKTTFSPLSLPSISMISKSERYRNFLELRDKFCKFS